MPVTTNVRIKSFHRLIPPAEIRSEIHMTKKAECTIAEGREKFCDILHGFDKRFVVIVGPCSIHELDTAVEYAYKLNEVSSKVSDKIFVLMRVYFEKPRTTIGWKGLINDPFLNRSQDMRQGLTMARKLMIDINAMGLPIATEILDPIIAAYIGELVSWVAIGARTTESQTHRQMASGLSAPVGFKNNTDGNLDVAINAMESVKNAHSFLGIDDEGKVCIIKTNGNPDTHVVLRGGNGKPNYHIEDIEECENKLMQSKFIPKIMIDCSHENSGKNYKKQKFVIKDIITQKQFGNESIFGIMVESSLFEGSQTIGENGDALKYGVSITDSCIGWEETEELLYFLHESI